MTEEVVNRAPRDDDKFDYKNLEAVVVRLRNGDHVSDPELVVALRRGSCEMGPWYGPGQSSSCLGPKANLAVLEAEILRRMARPSA